MAYTYRNKALKGINQNITASSGASQSQQQANRYNSQIANTPSYNGGAYANRISQIADDILNNRKDYSFGGQEAMSKFAMDYSALSGLGVAGAKADTDRLSGGYANSGSQAVADQYRNDYVTPLEQMETTQNIAQAGKQNQLDVGGMLNNANDLALAQYQDRMNALINGRDLAQSAYQALYGTDIDMANARQSALNELMGIESDLNYGKDNLKQSKREADQDYDLAKLALLASASSSSSGGRSGSGRSRKSSGSSGSSGGLSDSWLTDDTKSSSKNKEDYETLDLLPKKEILALGYGPISSKKIEELVENGGAEIYKDKKGNLHIKSTGAKLTNKNDFAKALMKGKVETKTNNGSAKKSPMQNSINFLQQNINSNKKKSNKK